MEDNAIQQLSEFEENYWWFTARKQIIRKILSKYNIKGKILDYGCGTGGTSLELQEFGTVIGTDISAKALELASTKIKTITISDLQNYENYFDVITLFDVLEHVNDDKTLLSKLCQFLKNNGLVLITVPAFQFLWSKHDIALSHYRRYTKKQLQETLKNANLKPLTSGYFMTFLFLPVLLYRIFNKNKETRTDLNKLPKIIDYILTKIFLLESRLIGYLPFGVSLYCIAKK